MRKCKTEKFTRVSPLVHFNWQNENIGSQIAVQSEKQKSKENKQQYEMWNIVKQSLFI